MLITLKPEYKQHLAYEALRDPVINTVFLGGGAGGGKSWFICESRLINCYLFPGYKSFIGRKELKRLMQSTYLTWIKVCKWHGVPETEWRLNGQYNFIEFKNGSRIDLLDMALQPADPLYERFGSLEYSDGAFEEAGEIDFLGYDVLKSRIGRHLNKELGIKPTRVITGNPKKNWTYTEFYKPWRDGKLPENTAFIQMLYKDNSYTSDDYGKVLSEIKDKQTRERLKNGNWEYDDDPTALISFEAIIDAFAITVKKSFERYLSADIARFGKDKIVIYLWEGLHLTKVYIFQKMGIDHTARKIREIALTEGVQYDHIIVDEDGVGGGVVDILNGIYGFIANSTPINSTLQINVRENYKSLKAQCSYKLAEMMAAHKIRIDANVVESPAEQPITNEQFKELLMEELGYIKTKNADNDRKLEVMPKDEIKEKLGRSPDFSDTLMMRMYFELLHPEALQEPTSQYASQENNDTMEIIV